jgi:ribonuclease HI
MTIIALYADGGVIGRNPSDAGGTFAWCHVDEADQRIKAMSGVIRPWASMPRITNNLTEMVALVLGMEALPAEWDGTVYSDSQITLGRVFRGWKMDGIPFALQRRAITARQRLGPVDFVLLDGHPTRAQLAAGIGKRGQPVSEHNVWCDHACCEQSKRAQAGIEL